HPRRPPGSAGSSDRRPRGSCPSSWCPPCRSENSSPPTGEELRSPGPLPRPCSPGDDTTLEPPPPLGDGDNSPSRTPHPAPLEAPVEPATPRGGGDRMRTAPHPERVQGRSLLRAQSSVTRSESWIVRTVSISSSALSAPQLPTISRTSVATPPRSMTAYRAAWTTVGRPGWVYPYSLAIQVVPSTSISPVPSSSSSGSAALRWSRPARAASSVNSGPKRCTVTTTFARNVPSTRGWAAATCTPGTVSVSQSSGI